jgi:hypothetical protein
MFGRDIGGSLFSCQREVLSGKREGKTLRLGKHEIIMIMVYDYRDLAAG